MADIAELGIKVLSDDIVKATRRLDKLEDQSKKSVKQNKTLGKSFGRLKGAIAAVGIGAIAKSIIGTAASFEKLEASLVTVTGSTEKASLAMQGITDFATTTPFQVEEITDAFIKLKALGIDPTEAKLRSFGNTSSAMGKSLNQMIEAVADAATGEFERLKEFGIKSKSEGDNVTFTFNGVATTVRKNSEEITAYLQSIGETKFASGMKNQMDTLDGAFSNFSDTVSLAVKKLSEESGFNELIKSATLGVSSFIRKLSGTETVDDFKEKITDVTEQIEHFKNEIKKAEESKEEKGFLASLIGGSPDAVIDNAQMRLELLNVTLAKLQEKANAAQAKAKGALDKAGKSVKDPEQEREDALDKEFEAASDHTDRMIRLFEMESEAKQKLKDNEDKMSKDRMNGMKGFLGNMSTLMASSSKKEFETGKKFALANAVVKGYESVVSAYAAGAKIHPAVGVAFAAAAAAATSIQIKNIQSQKFGGGSAGLSVSTGAGGGISTGSNFNGGAPAPIEGTEQQKAGVTYTVNVYGDSYGMDDLDTVIKESIRRTVNNDETIIESGSRQALDLQATG